MQPIDVHIHTNTHCNLKCIHCYEDADEDKRLRLSEDLEVNLIQFLCESYDADIHLEGGEIFLEEHLIQILLMINESTRKRITITSNGLIRSSNYDTIEVLRSLACLRISLEGHTEEMHSTVRGCCLQTVLDNALYYKNLGIYVVLRITLNALNADIMFSETIPALTEKGFNDFQIYEMQSVGRGKISGICIETPLDNFFNNWLRYPSTSNVKVSLPFRRIDEVHNYLPKLSTIGIEANEVGATAGVNIGVDGAVRICPWDMSSEPIVVVTDNNISELHSVISAQQAPHKCEYCTRIVLKRGVQC
jgi:MoaA/NifB/PqqE/SkfB family radical SAM enzyme